MQIRQRDIEQAYLDYNNTYNGVKEDYFALLYLISKFKLPREQAAAQVAFGGNDFGLDAFHFDREARNLFLYQFKWSESCALFRQSFTRLISAGMDAIFNTGGLPGENEFLGQLRAVVHENKALIDRVFVHFVFNGETAKANGSAVLNALREDLENKRYLLHQSLGRENVEFVIKYISNTDFKIAGNNGPEAPTFAFEIEYQSPLRTVTADGQKMNVGFVTLADLLRMYRTMGEKLFQRNIRSGLGGDKPANRAIKNTLRSIVLNGMTPDEFVFKHNGITLSAERAEPVSDTLVRIVEPRVLNGAQTITTVKKFCDENGDNPVLKEHEAKLRDTRVLARVITADSQEFVTQVTICNNRQNPVNAWNLRASDMKQLEFEDRFTEIGVFYERQEGAFAAFTRLPAEERGTRNITEFKPIEIRRLAHTFLATQGDIDKFSRISDVFENEKLYNETFRDAYLSVDPARIVVAYKIQFPLGKVVRTVIESSAAKFEILRRGKSLIWALLFQGVWNHSKFAEYVDSFGTSMSVQYAFVDLLNALAAQRVKPILVEAFKRPVYAAKIANEEFGFLRQNAFYKECMEIAWTKYGWKKCSLSTAAAAKA